MQNLQTTLTQLWLCVEATLKPVLANLDPSLFQNIVLGVLAIFIPFAIVFLTTLLNSKEHRNEFEKMVLNEKVLGTTRIFWLSILGIVVLAFFSGKDITVGEKLFTIVFSLVLILLFWDSFKRTLRFSEGYKPEFEISFLKSLNLSKIFTFRNKLKTERMIRAWSSFWSEKSTYNEREYTALFIKHIDDLIEAKKYGVAVSLGQAYKNHLDKRDRFALGYEILPKILEWNDRLWESEQAWLTRSDHKDRLQKIISQKHFPTFKKWIFTFLNKKESRPDFFWNWNYFERELFPEIAKILLHDGHGPYELFTHFKKYIDEAEEKLNKIEKEDRKQRWWNHMMGLFGVFCPLFFENIEKVSNNYEVWEHYFPREWKITLGNAENRISRVVLHEFLQWSHQRLLKIDESDYDKDLTEVVGGLFPNVHHRLFPAFLVLLFSAEVKSAVQKEVKFFLTNTGISWSGEKSEVEIQKMVEQQDLSQKEETVGLVLEYFTHWPYLRIYKDDISEEEFSNWESYGQEKRKEITDRVRKNKFNKVLAELNSAEVIEVCKKSERFEDQRQAFIELLQLLLKRIQ